VASLLVDLHGITARLAVEAAAGSFEQGMHPDLLALSAQLLGDVDQLGAVVTRATGAVHSFSVLWGAGIRATKQWLIHAVGLGERDAKAVLGRVGAMRGDFAATWEAWNGPSSRPRWSGSSTAGTATAP
jgi:hypothetical protein